MSATRELGRNPGRHPKGCPARDVRVRLSRSATFADRLRTGRTARRRNAYRGLAEIHLARVQFQAELRARWSSVLGMGDAAGDDACHLLLSRSAGSVV